ncbi:hypothetical protein [Actinomycetospora straminea]|uniref:hypothetical protein n=1 Tax=Actinomycetospora straminea TaxID=663607 RepID=UPI0023653013|nr:hypothetical protein [Actinomycetospora straminea]MDD7933713.1 hypothetical protein [Actinomycetospora straminea]
MDRNPLVDLFLLLVDRDGNANRRAALDAREAELIEHLRPGTCLLAQEAWQEIETWGLAALNPLPRGWTWTDVRAEAHVKENYFHPHAKSAGTATRLGGGRRELGREAARNYARVTNRCPEVRDLQRRVEEWLGAG